MSLHSVGVGGMEVRGCGLIRHSRSHAPIPIHHRGTITFLRFPICQKADRAMSCWILEGEREPRMDADERGCSREFVRSRSESPGR